MVNLGGTVGSEEWFSSKIRVIRPWVKSKCCCHSGHQLVFQCSIAELHLTHPWANANVFLELIFLYLAYFVDYMEYCGVQWYQISSGHKQHEKDT